VSDSISTGISGGRCTLPKPGLYLLIIAAVMIASGTAHADGEFELLSRTLIQGPARAAAFLEGGLVLGTGGGLVTFSTIDSLYREAFLPIEGEPFDIVTRGPTAYVASFRDGLRAVEISDLRHPVEVYYYRAPYAQFCFIARDYLYLADSRSRLYIFSIQDSSTPEFLRCATIPMGAISITAEGNLVSIIGSMQAKVFSVLDDGNLRHVSGISSPSTLKKGLLQDSILYLIDAHGEVRRWDLSDPAEPENLPSIPIKEVTHLAIDGTLGLLFTKSQHVIPFHPANNDASGAHAWKSGTHPVSGVRFGKPLEIMTGRPEKKWSRVWNIFKRSKKRERTTRFPGKAVLLSGSTLVTLDNIDGLHLFRVENGCARFTGSLSARGFAIDLVVFEGLLYLANGRDGLRIGSVDQDGSIEWIGHLQTTEARDVALEGTTLILADGRDDLKIIDVSDPRDPTLVGSRASTFFQSAIMVRDGIAYVAGGLGGVEIVDVSRGKQPQLVWRRGFSEVRGIDVDDTFLYIADGYEGFHIFSLEGEVPSPVSLFDTPGWNCDCFIMKDIAYLADGSKGIRIVDISNRAIPNELGAVHLNALTREIHAVPGTVFAAAHTAGVMAIDVTDPANPFIAAQYPTVDDARGVFADDRFVYLASGSGGVYIFRYIR